MNKLKIYLGYNHKCNKQATKQASKRTQTWTENLKFEASYFTIKLFPLFNHYVFRLCCVMHIIKVI